MNLFKRFFLDDRAIFGLIILNAVVIFSQGFNDLRDNEVLTYFDDFFSIMFILEMLVKARHFGWKNYLKYSWNRFDVLLIILSIPSLVTHIFPLYGLGNISFLLAARVFRVFKFFRLMQFFPQVEHIFRSAQVAMRSSFMVLMGFFVFIFIMGILSCYFYRDIQPEAFGNPIVAYYSTFKVFTVEGWNAIPEDLIKHSVESGNPMSDLGSALTKIYFIGLFIIGGVFGLSIVNSIFVDAMVSDNEQDAVQFDKLNEQVEVLQKQIQHLNNLLEQQILNKGKGDDPQV